MKISVQNLKGQPVGDVEFADDLLLKGRGTQAVIETVAAYRANQRAGTASTKTKGEVNGSGKKPWRQKGTGNARAGYRQSPVWRGGGVVFGPKPRDFGKRVPKAVGRLALRKAFSEKLAAGRVIVVDSFTVSEPKTKAVTAALKGLKIDGPALLILDRIENHLALAARNIPNVELATAATVHTYAVVRYPNIVVNQAALSQLESRLRGGKEQAS